MSCFSRFVSLGILLTIGLRMALPLLGSNSAEFDPWHTHFVIGVSSLREYTDALAKHRHKEQQSYAQYPPAEASLPARAAVPGSSGCSQVISVSGRLDGRLTILGIEAQAWLIPVVPSLVAHLHTFRQARLQTPLFLAGMVTPPPKPPPRLSF
jgi:hypothetical protein